MGRLARGSSATLKGAAAVLAALGLAGCATYEPVERTPEGILDAVGPGDRVRVTTRDADELELLVWTVGDSELAGRRDGGDSEEVARVRYDRIERINVRRLNFRKAMLTTFVPVIVAAIVFCNNTDECETRSLVKAEF